MESLERNKGSQFFVLIDLNHIKKDEGKMQTFGKTETMEFIDELRLGICFI